MIEDGYKLPRQQREGERGEHVDDPYKLTKKLKSPTLCPDCGAVFEDGRWRWTEAPYGAPEHRCQACARMRDNYPAGEIRLTGSFLIAHRSEIEHLVRNEAEAQKKDHPLSRLMDIEGQDDSLVVTTTDIHLPRRIGHALERAYQGNLSIHYDEDGYFTRVAWHRN